MDELKAHEHNLLVESPREIVKLTLFVSECPVIAKVLAASEADVFGLLK